MARNSVHIKLARQRRLGLITHREHVNRLVELYAGLANKGYRTALTRLVSLLEA